MARPDRDTAPDSLDTHEGTPGVVTAEVVPAASSRHRIAWSRRLVAAPLLFVALSMIWLAAPRAIGGIATGTGEPILHKVRLQQAVSIEQVQELIASQQRGLRIIDDPVMAAELGRGELLMVEKLSLRDESAPEHLVAAVTALRHSLHQAPANPLGWTLLAYAEFLRDSQWRPPALAALRMSMDTGPYEPQLLWSRLRLALFAWDALPPDDRDLVRQQIRFGWDEDPEALARMAVDLRQTAIVARALSLSPDDAATFDRLVQAQPSR